MGIQLINDFIVETKGHCFLCLHRIYPDPKSEASPLKINSIHCLSRYLKTDMSKVFVGEGPIPLHLLAMLQKSQLKVELCKECFSINKRFLKLYRQLEKVELEMKSYVEVILSRIGKEADAVNKTRNFRELAELDESFGTGKFQVVEALRKEISENCLQKLDLVDTAYPKVTTANLTMKQVNNKKRRMKCNENKNTPQFDIRFGDNPPSPSLSSYDTTDLHQDFDLGHVKLEPSFNNKTRNMSLDDSNLDGLDSNESGDSFTPMATEGKTQKTTYKVVGVKTVEDSSKKFKLAKPERMSDIPPPLKIAANVESLNEEQFSQDASTGNFQCRFCQREYSSQCNLNFHFKTVHLKERYKCETCGKEFSQKTSYDIHYMNVHIGVRYKCTNCDKVFTLKVSLKAHQKTNKCKPKQRV